MPVATETPQAGLSLFPDETRPRVAITSHHPCGWKGGARSPRGLCPVSVPFASFFTLCLALGSIAHPSDTRSCILRVGNILFSVETQTTEERTQLYHAEIDALYKDLTAKGKVLILSSEFGVGVCVPLVHAACGFSVNEASALSWGSYILCLKSALVVLYVC